MLVAIGSLAYFGVFNIDRFIPSRCFCSYENLTQVERFSMDDVEVIRCYDKSDVSLVDFKCENKTLVPME